MSWIPGVNVMSDILWQNKKCIKNIPLNAERWKKISISNETLLRNKVTVYSFKCIYHAGQQWILAKHKIYLSTLSHVCGHGE